MSGFKIYPGHGKRFVRADGRLMIFNSKKCESLFKDKKNPRKIDWTVLYRKLHKKGFKEESQKRKTKKVVKVQRDIDGNTLQNIMKIRNETPAARTAKRESAIASAKEKVREKRAKKVQISDHTHTKAQNKSVKQQTQARMKQPRASRARVGGKR